MTRGKLIVISGIDGVGKSTLATQLQTAGIGDLHVAEPTPTFQQARALYAGSDAALPYLFFADRAALYQQRVLPALAQGCTVVSDRNWFCTAAYQERGVLVHDHKASALSFRTMLSMARHACGVGAFPDAVILLETQCFAKAQARSLTPSPIHPYIVQERYVDILSFMPHVKYRRLCIDGKDTFTVAAEAILWLQQEGIIA